MSRAEDLQGQMDRVAVKETLRGVAGGTVSASALIDRFAGTLFKQSRRVKVPAAVTVVVVGDGFVAYFVPLVGDIVVVGGVVVVAHVAV